MSQSNQHPQPNIPLHTDDNTEGGVPATLYKPEKEDTQDDAVEDDGTPVLDEQDLEENGITEEEAENIEWDEPKKGSKS